MAKVLFHYLPLKEMKRITRLETTNETLITPNAKLSGKMQLAKMCSEAKRSQL